MLAVSATGKRPAHGPKSWPARDATISRGQRGASPASRTPARRSANLASAHAQISDAGRPPNPAVVERSSRHLAGVDHCRIRRRSPTTPGPPAMTANPIINASPGPVDIAQFPQIHTPKAPSEPSKTPVELPTTPRQDRQIRPNSDLVNISAKSANHWVWSRYRLTEVVSISKNDTQKPPVEALKRAVEPPKTPYRDRPKSPKSSPRRHPADAAFDWRRPKINPSRSPKSTKSDTQQPPVEPSKTPGETLKTLR